MYKLVKLNLARNCLRYAIKTYGISQIWLPYYTCPTVWQAVRKENCKIKFYHIDKDFLPTIEFDKDDFILYTNYFGLNSENCKILAKKYPNIIIDNSQSFYTEPMGLCSFQSLRKFFNVQYGAYLYTKKVLDYKFEIDNLVLEPIQPKEDYNKFVQNEIILNSQNIKSISPLVEKQMQNIDFENDKKERILQFNTYKKELDKYNEIKLSPNDNEIPYCYPLQTDNIAIKKQLANNGEILIKLWQTATEKHFSDIVGIKI